MLIKRFGLIRYGMNQETANAENGCRLTGPQYRVLQQSDAQAPALPACIDSQTAKYSHGHGVGHIATDRTGSIRQVKSA